MKSFLLSTTLVVLLLSLVNADSNADLVNTKVERTIDITTNVVHINHVITVENKATSGALKSYTFVVEPALVSNIAVTSAILSGSKTSNADELDKRRLNVAVLSNDAKKRHFV